MVYGKAIIVGKLGTTLERLVVSVRPDVMSVSVSPLEQGKDRFNKIYVGTEPSALYT